MAKVLIVDDPEGNLRLMIVRTGLQHPANIRHARNLGAGEKLVKPLDEAVFAGTVEPVPGKRARCA
jgi:hypothetical protein